MPSSGSGSATGTLGSPALDYDFVRLAIAAGLTTADLPNADIDKYAPVAFAWVLQQDPSAASRTGDELAAVNRAYVFRTAALLCPTLPPQILVKRDVTLNEGVERDWDPQVRAGELNAQAVVELASLTTAGRPAVFKVFGLAPGRRGR